MDAQSTGVQVLFILSFMDINPAFYMQCNYCPRTDLLLLRNTSGYLHIFQHEDNTKHLVQVQNNPASNLPGLLMNISRDIVPRYPRGALWILLRVAGKENTTVAQGYVYPGSHSRHRKNSRA